MNRRDFLFGSASVAALAVVPMLAAETLERFWLRDGTVWGKSDLPHRMWWSAINDATSFEPTIYESDFGELRLISARFLPISKTANAA